MGSGADAASGGARPPMKRHPSLVPLSRDHHHGLVMARRLILGGPSTPRDDWPRAPEEQASRLIAFYESALRPHFEAEEAQVFPLAAERLADGPARVEALVAQHRMMTGMIEDLRADLRSGIEKRLAAFGELLRDHIHDEERILFERMQAECGEEEMEALGSRLAAGAASAPACAR